MRWLAWIATALVAFLALVRLLHLESLPITVMLIAASPVLLMAAVPIAGFGLATKRWVMFGSMGLIALMNLAGIAGERGARAQVAEAGPQLVVATANIEVGNEQLGEMLGNLAADADVVFLQEITDVEVDLLQAAPAWDLFPFRVLDPRPGFHGSAILSKLPLDDGGVVWVDGWPMTAAIVTLPGALPNTSLEASLVNVHVQAPLSETGRWAAQMRELGRFAQHHDRGVILAGDFNSAGSHSPMQDLLGVSLTDAHLQSGSGFGATWPAGGIAPSILRLDRVLVNEHFAPLKTQTFDAVGSNHRGVLSRLEVVTPEGASEN